MISASNSILNPYLPTFYIRDVQNGQTLVYDHTKRAFVNSSTGGSTGATSLDSLADVQLNVPGLLAGQALIWNGPNNWTNQFINYSTLVGKPVLAPVATAGTLGSLNDVDTSGVLDGYTLVWSDSASRWEAVSNPAGSTTLSSLTDVDIATRTNNQIMYYDSSASEWKNVNLATLAKQVQSVTSLSDVNTTIVPDGYLKWNPSGTEVTFATTIPSSAVSGLASVATSGNYVDLSNKPTIPTLVSQLTNDSGYLTSATGVSQIIAGSNITITPGSGKGTVTINSTATSTTRMEKVVIQYTAGNAGNFIGVTPITTSGVSVNIIDAANCVASYSFTGYTTPPVAVMVYGQNYTSNIFSYRSGSQLPINNSTIQGGGTAASPNIINGIVDSSTPMTLQTRMSDTGASAGFGQRAYLMILFKF